MDESAVTEALEKIAKRLEDPNRVVLDSSSIYEDEMGKVIEWWEGEEEPPRACFIGWINVMSNALSLSDDYAVWGAIDDVLDEMVFPLGHTEALQKGLASKVVRKAQAKVERA